MIREADADGVLPRSAAAGAPCLRWSRSSRTVERAAGRKEADVDPAGFAGDPDAEGFVITGPTSLWHLSTGRGADASHSADDSFYFGGRDRGSRRVVPTGECLRRVDFTMDQLTHASGAIELQFNHLLDLADKDEVRIRDANGRRRDGPGR